MSADPLAVLRAAFPTCVYREECDGTDECAGCSPVSRRCFAALDALAARDQLLHDAMDALGRARTAREVDDLLARFAALNTQAGGEA